MPPRSVRVPAAPESILLTGATGFLGRHLLWGLLRQLPPDGAVHCLVRAGSAAEAERRLAQLLDACPTRLAPGVRARCHAVWGDVTQDALACEPSRAATLAAEVDRIVHCAAAVKFNLPLEVARRVNVTGTRNVLRFAEGLHGAGRLRRLDYVGTAYVAGDTRGRVFEDQLLDGIAFHNTYERTKWEAERLVRRYQAHLPITIFRPSIVVGDSQSGATASFKMLYWPLKLLASGSIPFAPIESDGILDVVPIDYVVAAVLGLTASERSLGRCYHLAAGGTGQSSTAELLAQAADFFAVRPPPTIPPRLAFGLVSPFLYVALWGKRRDLLRKAHAYLPYFAYHASFDTSVAAADLKPLGLQPPLVESYFRSLLQFAVDTDWGRRSDNGGPPRAPGRPRPGAAAPWGRLTPLVRLVTDRLDPDDPTNRDPEFIRLVAPALDWIGRYYFRSEGEGLEHVPAEGAFIMAANHNGGPIMPDVWMMLSYWTNTFGAERPAYAMVHDFALRIPVLNNFLMRIGALRARPANAAKALALGAGVLIYPGGELDCLRSFWRRNRIDLHGRTGFIALAYREGVPIVPLVNIGGHEVYVTLFSSRRLARWSGLEALTNVKTVPLILGLPWGVWLTGFVPYIPLPSKLVYKVGEPLHLPHQPALAQDREALAGVYRQVTEAMQDLLDDLARRRRFPVLG